MLIRLEKIGAEAVHWQESPEIPAEALERPEVLGIGRISWSGSVWAEHPGYRFEGRLSYDQTLACGRCLAPIVEPVETTVRLMLVVVAEEPSEGEYELAEEELELLAIEEEFDTDSVLHEQLQLNVPMRTLCKDDCRGLCPICGGNRNEESCDCEAESVDPRWEALKGLRRE